MRTQSVLLMVRGKGEMVCLCFYIFIILHYSFLFQLDNLNKGLCFLNFVFTSDNLNKTLCF